MCKSVTTMTPIAQGVSPIPTLVLVCPPDILCLFYVYKSNATTPLLAYFLNQSQSLSHEADLSYPRPIFEEVVQDSNMNGH